MNRPAIGQFFLSLVTISEVFAKVNFDSSVAFLFLKSWIAFYAHLASKSLFIYLRHTTFLKNLQLPSHLYKQKNRSQLRQENKVNADNY